MRLVNLIVFGIATALSLFCLIYYLSEYNVKDYLFEMHFLTLLASIAYFSFLIIYEIKSQKQGENYQNIASESNRIYMTTVFSKYLFSIYFATLFVFICVDIIGSSFKIFDGYHNFWVFLLNFHLRFFIPLFMLAALYLVEHTRAPNYLTDMIMIATIFLVRWGIALLLKALLKDYYKISDGIRELGQQVLIGILLSINGYYFYDYILFRKSNREGIYSIMISS